LSQIGVQAENQRRAVMLVLNRVSQLVEQPSRLRKSAVLNQAVQVLERETWKHLAVALDLRYEQAVPLRLAGVSFRNST
jgi:hypothetical protein